MGKHDDLKKFSEFPVPTYEQWREVTEKSLKGKPFDTLLTKLLDDIVLQPMYQERDIVDRRIKNDEPGQFPFTRGTSSDVKPWKVSQELSAKTPVQLNEILRYDLERGQNVYHVVFQEAVKRGAFPDRDEEGYKTPLVDKEDVETIFSGLDVSAYPLHIDAGEVSLPMLAALSSFANEKALTGIVASDPIHQLAKNGTLSYPLERAFDHMAEAVRWAKDHAPELKTVLVQTEAYHNGGASPAVELAVALSTGVAYVKALLDRGIDVDDAGRSLAFTFSLGSEFFTELSKIRVARTLWAAVMKEFGASENGQKMYIHARTSSFTKTKDDVYVNILRGTIEAFAGAASNVDSLHVTPFDEAVQEPTSFSRRIARNTSLILQEESHIDKTIDPAGGSWYVEHLTDELAQKAWEKFQEIEREGGIIAALEKGTVQAWVDEAWNVRIRDVKQRKQVIVGVNQYVNLEEKFFHVCENEDDGLRMKYYETVDEKRANAKAAPSSRSFDDVAKLVNENVPFARIHESLGANAKETLTVKPIPKRRLAEPFEQLRARTKQLGTTPTVYLIGLGKLADYKARADFISGFFWAGGFHVKTGEGDEALTEAKNYDLVVLCGKDDAYVEQAIPIVEKVKAQNDRCKCFVAGRQDEAFQQALERAGVDDFIHVKTNVYDFLTEVQEWLKGGRVHA